MIFEKLQMAYMDLTQLERVHTKKPSLTMIDGKPTNGTSTSKKDQDGHGMTKSENF